MRQAVAIFSLNHRPIGKTTQSKPYTASSHVGYITREGAKPQIAGARMPLDKDGAMAFFRAAEDGSRSNARVGDKLMLALPVELSPEQRVELVRGFAEEITGGRAPWFAAFHDNRTDASNPHCHLIFRDRCPASGRRVFGTSEAGSTERLRRLWQAFANDALEQAGRPERIDHRTLEAQGIDRPATIHEGPRSQHARRRGHRPKSRAINARNGKGAKSRQRRVDYPRIDRGRTRGQYNQGLIGPEGERDYWAAIDADGQQRELESLRAIHHPPASVVVGPFERQDAGTEIFEVALPSKEAVPASPFPHGVSDLESSSHGLFPFQRGNEPSAQEKALGATQEGSAEGLGKQNQPIGPAESHRESFAQNNGLGKGNIMEDIDQVLRRHQRDVNQAAVDRNEAKTDLDRLMTAAFRNPDAVRANMDKFCQRHTRGELYDYLRDRFNNNKFVQARPPGTRLSIAGYKPGARVQRLEADAARKALPDALERSDRANANYDRAVQTRDNAMRTYGRMPSDGQGDGSGSAGVSPATPVQQNTPHPGRPDGQLPEQQPRSGSGAPSRPESQSQDPADGGEPPKQAVGPAERGKMPRQPNPPREGATSSQGSTPLASPDRRQDPSARPPRFSEASRGQPREPVPFTQPKRGEQPPQAPDSMRPSGSTARTANRRPNSGQQSSRDAGGPDMPERAQKRPSFSERMALPKQSEATQGARLAQPEQQRPSAGPERPASNAQPKEPSASPRNSKRPSFSDRMAQPKQSEIGRNAGPAEARPPAGPTAPVPPTHPAGMGAKAMPAENMPSPARAPTRPRDRGRGR